MPNQNLNIVSQLNQGVRAFMLDVYSQNGTLMLYHSVDILGSSLFSDALNEFKIFIDQNPNEIITIILEDYSSFIELSDALSNAGIIEFLYEYDETEGWPNLQDMIDVDKRIVLFSDNDIEDAPSWFHFLWDHAVETHFNNELIEDFSCDFNRGDEQNALFILNHFITNYELVIGNIELYNAQVEEVNSNPYFFERVYECLSEKDKFPNFITVDFYDVGNCLEVVNDLNELNTYSLKEFHYPNLIFPNPSNGMIYLNTSGLNISSKIRITNIQGQVIKLDYSFENINEYLRLNLSSIEKGFYFLHVGDFISPFLLID